MKIPIRRTKACSLSTISLTVKLLLNGLIFVIKTVTKLIKQRMD